MDKGKFLIDYNAFRLEKTFIDDFISPYVIKLPRPTPIKFLKIIGDETINSHHNLFRKSVHLIGIPNSGIPISTSIGLSIFEQNDNVSLSIFDPEKFNGEITQLDRNIPLILIDNSIKSGKTVNEALIKLKELGFEVNFIITLFNREEIREELIFKSEFHKTPIIYLYSILDIIGFLEPNNRTLIIEHLKEHGTNKAKQFIKQF